jgi:predicted DCC family thiol-disulfide oxidoreductase YuxK
MSDLCAKQGVWLIYDGECPMCGSVADALRIKQQYGELHLIDARVVVDDELLRQIKARGYDLDEGVVIFYQNRFYHGTDAVKFMADHGSVRNIFNIFCKGLFWSEHIIRLTYPWLRGIRNNLLRRRNVSRIDNLGLKETPIFKPVFGCAWRNLPLVMRRRYGNRPYTNDTVIIEGQVDVMCKRYIRVLSPLIRLVGSVPPYNQKNVPVTVHFVSWGDKRMVGFNRVFYFKKKEPYAFRSRMLPATDNEVLEMLRFGICVRMTCFWQDSRVYFRHKEYTLNVFGHFVRLPVSWIIGRVYAEERPVDDETFDTVVQIQHPWFGKVYEYTGRFKIANCA